MTVLIAMVGALCSVKAHAGGPRFITGTTYAMPGQPMAWYTATPQYYTDPGDLSPTVTHAQADTLVAAAANVWNVPTAMLTLSQGGTLSEHISGDNTYFDGTRVVFPADVQATNYLARPIAIVYDSDGSITDLLLGSGASSPSSCRQNAVTESVDSFGASGTIQHAVMVLNGRCVTNTSDSLLQMQYWVARAFGRVLGLSWSQCNDNVFTASPTPTVQQPMYWPLMHPIDVLCGPYTYKCMASPFTLRPDDLSALAMLYPVTSTNVVSGKTVDRTLAYAITNTYMFPSGQGMELVNETATLEPFTKPVYPYILACGVSGIFFAQDSGNPVSERTVPAASNVGTSDQSKEGSVWMERVPISTTYNSLVVTAEAINPLYTGAYAVGPYEGTPIAPSGMAPVDDRYLTANGGLYVSPLATSDAATSCAGSDGTEATPLPADATGWWTGVICGLKHVSWRNVQVRAGRTWAIEVTSLDESGAASAEKLRPVIGVWSSTDPAGTTATVAAQGVPMSGAVAGLTALAVPARAGTFRVAVADKLGGGRPDFAYKARVLYADSVVPGNVPAAGGTITITGTGFRAGNRVLVNGTAASVVSWTSNQIVATAPSAEVAGIAASGSTTAVDVAVVDATTLSSTVMSGALLYAANTVDVLRLVSAPSSVQAGASAAVPVVFEVLQSDGMTVAAGAQVKLKVTAGTATLSACNGASFCTLTADSHGLISTGLAAGSAGVITVTGTELSGGASAAATLPAVADLVLLRSAPALVEVGVPSTTPFAVRVLASDGTTAMVGAKVALAVTSGSGTLSACGGASSCTVQADTNGVVSSAIIASALGTMTVSSTETAGDGSVAASMTAAVKKIVLVSAPSALAVGTPSAQPVVFKVLGLDGSTALAGASVSLRVAGPATLSGCAANPCTVLTDASGLVTTGLTATQPGAIAVTATELSGGKAVATITATADKLVLVSAPSLLEVGVASSTAFSVRVFAGDGVTAMPGARVQLALAGQGGSGSLSACGAANSCTVAADASGLVFTAVTASAAGTLTVSATEVGGGAAVSATMTAGLRKIVFVSAPAVVPVGVAAAQPVVLKVLDVDGSTPVAGATVGLAVTAGMAVPGVCGAAGSCSVTTDAQGTVSTTIRASSAGAIGLTATESSGGAQATATLQAVADQVVLSSAPAALETGITASTPLVIRVISFDGVHAAAGASVRLAVVSGSALLAACGAPAQCTVTADANGVISTTLTGQAAGGVVLAATELSGGSTLRVALTDSDPTRSITLGEAVHYVAAGIGSSWTVTASALQDAVPVPAPLAWSSTAGVTLSSAAAVTSAQGSASAVATVNNPAAGAPGSVNVCAWTSTCAAQAVVAVSADNWAVAAVSGAGQSVAQTSSLGSVTLQITDDAGHPLANVPVVVYQTVQAWEGTCTTVARCPAAPVLTTLKTQMTADANGLVNVTPLEVAGVPQVVHITAVVGTQGATSVTLYKTP